LNRIPESGFCYEHKNKCEFDGCLTRISCGNNHCSQHPPQVQAKYYKEKLEKERNDFKNQLTKKDEEIAKKGDATKELKKQLKMEMGDERYEAWIEEEYRPQFNNI